MKRILVIISAFALSTGIAYAMDEDAMDKDMMMEAAPSVSLSGEAELGFKNVDDDDDDNEAFHLIRAYKVSFSSQGTTDGGLVFGAGISIRDDTTETDAHGHDDGNGATSVQGPAVKGSNVFIGAADGSWKLKLGGNDPGIEQAGGIGVADDHFDGGNSAAIGFEGAFGGTSYRLTVADPQAKDDSKEDGDWSVGASHSLGDINVGFGMDSEKGLAVAVGTDISGVGLNLYYSKSEESDPSLASYRTSILDAYGELKDVGADNTLADDGTALTGDPLTAYNTAQGNVFPATSVLDISEDEIGSLDNTGLGVKASMSAGEGATFSVAYSTLKTEHATATKIWYVAAPVDEAAGVRGDAAANISGTVESETKLIEIGFNYDLGGGATLKTSVEKKEVETTATVQGTNTVALVGTGDSAVGSASDTTKSDTTTMKALIAFTF